MKDLILSEVNVKEVEYLGDTAGILVKKIKPDFKKLGTQIWQTDEIHLSGADFGMSTGRYRRL